MRRRDFIALLGGGAAWPLSTRAQQPDRVRRVGMLLPAVRNPESPYVLGFRQKLAELGWIDGRTVSFEEHWGNLDIERTRAAAAELARLKPDVIFTVSIRTLSALKQATRTIPIVFAAVPDPVGNGFVESLARPGGNMTGFALPELSIVGKMLETLRQIAPRVERVALLFSPNNF